MTISVRPTGEFVRQALKEQSVWDLGNQTLYELCRKHPDHRSVDTIVAKVWLIGRSYASAIERRRVNREVTGDDFYVGVVAPAIRASKIDHWFAELRPLRRPAPHVVVAVHKRLTDLFRQISGQDKRSLASKYLHFHVPKAVYIYDERASRAIRQVTSPLRSRARGLTEYDDEYAQFYLRCEVLRAQLEQVIGRAMTPREVDKVLLAVADRG